MLDFYTAPTPNGWKISIMLEELGLDYQLKPVRLDQDEQKQPGFLEISPNGRIPAIVDRENDHFAVFESGAILIYLAEKYGQLLPSDRRGRSTALQWLMFQMGGIGPMMGQAYWFLNYADRRDEFAINRYVEESRRLLGVLDGRLEQVPYLAGEYSIADIANYPWVKGEDIGISMNDFPHVSGWLERVGQRPAVQRGLGIPTKEEYYGTDQTAETTASG